MQRNRLCLVLSFGQSVFFDLCSFSGWKVRLLAVLPLFLTVAWLHVAVDTVVWLETNCNFAIMAVTEKLDLCCIGPKIHRPAPRHFSVWARSASFIAGPMARKFSLRMWLFYTFPIWFLWFCHFHSSDRWKCLLMACTLTFDGPRLPSFASAPAQHILHIIYQM